MLLGKYRFLSRIEWLFITLVIGSMAVAVFQLSHYDDNTTLDYEEEKFLHSALIAGAGSGSFIEAQKSDKTRSILLPVGFNIPESLVRDHLKKTASESWPIFQLSESQVFADPPEENQQFQAHEPFSMYRASEKGDCDEDFRHIIDDVEINSRRTLPGNLTRILELMVEEHDQYQDPFYKYIRHLVLTHTRAELAANVVNTFWFRLSGSSVWLKDYNVHFVVSRFLLADKRDRLNPKVSFLLAQVFDENWKELQDVRLVFPSNSLDEEEEPTFKVDGQHFYSYRFPRILPVPFDSGSDERTLGSEDPRLILIRNKNGHDEPVAIFNSRYDQSTEKEEGKEEAKEQKVTIRAMFMAFPFQITRGKKHLAQIPEPKTDNIIFTRSLELQLDHKNKPNINKNWSPMVGYAEREANGGYDKNLYFATNLENLEIVRCTLDTADCAALFKKQSGGVGPLRGGTPFYNLNSLLRNQKDIPLHKLLPSGREVFFAFARAHLSHCGCGIHFYRPNMVVLVMDRASYGAAQTNGDRVEASKYFFRQLYVSDFMSLHVPIDPWYVEDPYGMCEGTNALIPNGISSWTLNSLKEQDGKWVADDRMLLLFSVSDFSVDRVDMKGVLNMLLNLDSNLAFLPPPSAEGRKHEITVPLLGPEGTLIEELMGQSRKNIDCAIDSSKKFCTAFTREQELFRNEKPMVDKTEENEKYKEKMEEFEKTYKEEIKSEAEKNKHLDGSEEED